MHSSSQIIASMIDGRRCLDHIREIGHMTAVLARRAITSPPSMCLPYWSGWVSSEI